MADFDRLGVWDRDRLEDLRFWCEPGTTLRALKEIERCGFPHFDGLATFEARGFYLAGMLAATLQLPTVFIRKHKPFYDKVAHQSVTFTNWKGEIETLSILGKTLPRVSRVLVVDDILDTGNSLRAGVTLLEMCDIKTIGAFYLLRNSGQSENTKDLGFPVFAAIEHKLL